jgi:hypothetical protein
MTIQHISLSPWLSKLIVLNVEFDYDTDKMIHQTLGNRTNQTLATFIPLLLKMTSLTSLTLNAYTNYYDDDFNVTFNFPKLKTLRLITRTIPTLNRLLGLEEIYFEHIYAKDLLRVFDEISHVDKITIQKIFNYKRDDDPGSEDYPREVTSKLLTVPLFNIIPYTHQPKYFDVGLAVTKFICYGLNKKFVPLLYHMKNIQEITLQTCFQSYDVIGNLFRQWSSSLCYVDFTKSIIDSKNHDQIPITSSSSLSHPIINLPRLITLKMCNFNQELANSLSCPNIIFLSLGDDSDTDGDNDVTTDANIIENKAQHGNLSVDNSSDNDNHSDDKKYDDDNYHSSVDITLFLNRIISIITLVIFRSFTGFITKPSVLNSLLNLLVSNSLCPNVKHLSLSIPLSTENLKIITRYHPTRLNYLSLATNDTNSNDLAHEEDAKRVESILNIVERSCTSTTLIDHVSLYYCDLDDAINHGLGKLYPTYSS